MAKLEKYSQNEIPTSAKFNSMVDAVNANTDLIAQLPPELCDSAAGSEGQVLTRTADGSATWKTPSGGGGGAVDGEAVRIVVSTNVDGVSVEGLRINVYYNDTTTDPIELTTDARGMCAVRVPADYKYRIAFPDIEGCDPITDVVHTAVMSERSIEVTYKPLTVEKEVLNVICRKYANATNVALPDKIVKITIAGNTTEYTTNSSGKVSLEIPTGTDYTVSINEEEGFYLHGGYSYDFKAGKSTRNVYFSYHDATIGVFFVDADGNEYTRDEWLASGKNGDDAVMLKVATAELIKNNGVFYLLIDDIAQKRLGSKISWCNQNVLFNNIPSNGSSASALYYYDGKSATDAIIDEANNRGLSANAAIYARNKSYTLGGGHEIEGFLWSVGQDRIIHNNITLFDEMIRIARPNAAYSMTNIRNESKWTSGQNNTNACYCNALVANSTKVGTSYVLVAYA